MVCYKVDCHGANARPERKKDAALLAGPTKGAANRQEPRTLQEMADQGKFTSLQIPPIAIGKVRTKVSIQNPHLLKVLNTRLVLEHQQRCHL